MRAVAVELSGVTDHHPSLTTARILHFDGLMGDIVIEALKHRGEFGPALRGLIDSPRFKFDPSHSDAALSGFYKRMESMFHESTAVNLEYLTEYVFAPHVHRTHGPIKNVPLVTALWLLNSSSAACATFTSASTRMRTGTPITPLGVNSSTVTAAPKGL